MIECAAVQKKQKEEKFKKIVVTRKWEVEVVDELFFRGYISLRIFAQGLLFLRQNFLCSTFYFSLQKKHIAVFSPTVALWPGLEYTHQRVKPP